MQGYRAPPPSTPLITLLRDRLFALDPESGALRWEKQVSRAVARIAVTDSHVFLVDTMETTTLHMFDIATGQERGSLALDFHVTAVLQTADRLYFAGGGGLIAMTHASGILFRLSSETTKEKQFSESTHEIVGRSGNGQEMFRIRDVKAYPNSASLLALGANIAQIDLRD